jgi:hypothetical protein
VRLSDLKTATGLAQRREALLKQLNAVSIDTVSVKIGGLPVGEPELIAFILPEIVTKLQRLTADVESDLLKLGVRLH